MRNEDRVRKAVTVVAMDMMCTMIDICPKCVLSNGRLGLFSFNNAALPDSMLDNVSMPPSRGGGGGAPWRQWYTVFLFWMPYAMVHVNSHA